MRDKNWPAKRQNLALLALGLHRLSERVGDLNFNMLRFLGKTANAPLEGGGAELKCELQHSDQERHECGTTACAVGHGPSFGIRPILLEIDRDSWIYTRRVDPDWGFYTERAFLPVCTTGCYSWMFDASWGRSEIFDHRYLGEERTSTLASRAHAAKRIAWCLKFSGDAARLCGPLSYHSWRYLREFQEFEPDWEEIEKMIPAKALEGIAWIDRIQKVTP